MKAKIGEMLLVLSVIMWVVGGTGYVAGFLPQDAIVTIGALALMFMGAGLGMKRQVQKQL